MIYQFLDGSIPDYKNRYLTEILKYSDQELEYEHDYIQVLFPLYEESVFNIHAHILTEYEEKMIKANIESRKGLNSALTRMIKFYKNNDHWMTDYNHNHLRITRIIKCVSTLLCEDRAIEFYNFIIHRCYSRGFYVSDETLDYWYYAIYKQNPPKQNPLETMFEHYLDIINNYNPTRG